MAIRDTFLKIVLPFSCAVPHNTARPSNFRLHALRKSSEPDINLPRVIHIELETQNHKLTLACML